MTTSIRRRSILTAAGLTAAAPAVLAARPTARESASGSLTPTAQHRPAPTLSDEQLAGQRVIHSYAGKTPPQALLSALRNGLSAGVLIGTGNIDSVDQIAEVTAQLRDAAAAGPVDAGLLLMTDQEGGQVRRLPGAPDLSAKQVGQQDDPTAAATDAGTGAAATLTSAGMNVNLAPVLGVYRSAGDFLDQYGRSFGSDADAVAPLGAAFVTAQQRHGVAATAKHFPGLGAATADQNTDAEPVTLRVPASALRSVDEAVYPASIDAGVRLVMASWAVYPQLDADWPAGLSSRIIGNELRGRLGFTGVTITDALSAGALRDHGGLGQRAVLAASAGMDLMLCTGGVQHGEQARAGLADALGSGDLPRPAFQAAVDRVTTLRTDLD